MTELRRRMIEDMQLQGLTSGTQQAYVRAVRVLAEHYHRSPDQLTDEQLREFFLYLERKRGQKPFRGRAGWPALRANEGRGRDETTASQRRCAATPG